MKLGYKYTLENNVRKAVVYIKQWGSDDLTEEQEKNMIKDYSPKFEYRDLTFSGKYKLDSNNNVIKDNVSGEDVTLSKVNKVIEIKDNMECDFTISTSQVKDSDIEGKSILNTKDKYAEAMCYLFTDVVTDKIKTIITGIKAKENDFEKEDRESEEF